MIHRGPRRRHAAAGVLAILALIGLLALGVAGSAARPQEKVTISMFASVTFRPAYDVLIPNFERVYPNINVNIAYGQTLVDMYRIERTQLAAGNAPDIFSVWPGCGTPISVCTIAKQGYAAQMVKKPWVKRSHPLLLGPSKYDKALFTFSPTATLDGIWTNDTLFAKLGLKVPQTFAQLLDICPKAKAAGTVPLLLAAQGSGVIQQLVADIALTTVYAKDKQWAKKLRAGTVTFQGTPGWHQALQEIVELKNAGCFQPGPAGLSSAQGDAQFSQGRALMYVCLTSHKGPIDAAHPQIAYSQRPWPAPTGTAPSKTKVLLNLGQGLVVNAHSSAQHQAAAQTFVDFVARPKQNGLFAQISGGLSPYQLHTQELPKYLSTFSARFKNHEYAVNPIETWWNAEVGTALTDYGTGLITGQTTVDDVLKAMDVAWKLGPT
jgi:raffinose/stachyose/melibiose transport system substrate-binding protein